MQASYDTWTRAVPQIKDRHRARKISETMDVRIEESAR